MSTIEELIYQAAEAVREATNQLVEQEQIAQGAWMIRDRLKHYGHADTGIDKLIDLDQPKNHKALGCTPPSANQPYGWDCDDENDDDRHPHYTTYLETVEWVEWVLNWQTKHAAEHDPNADF